jgi:diguanylate cyclase (GGDEF)-like protein
MVADVDAFKRVNDTFGHDVGDRVIRVVGERLRRAVRSEDVVGRLGGDEFGVVLADADGATLRAVSERIVAAVAEPMAAGGRVLRVAVSVGVAAGEAGADPDGLVRRADLAMYAAKRDGGGRNAFAAAAWCCLSRRPRT